MKCPRCGTEMVLDGHRRYDLNMCYECGYIEGSSAEKRTAGETNYERLEELNFNEAAAFISNGLGVDLSRLTMWLDSRCV